MVSPLKTRELRKANISPSPINLTRAEKELQRHKVVELLLEDQKREEFGENEERFVLSMDWFKRWEKFTSEEGAVFCGKISNSNLLERDMFNTGSERV